MVEQRQKNRLRPPLMFAFRDAHEKKDARKKIDLRDEQGDRVIAGRRAAPRAALSEQRLRYEVARDLDALVNAVNLGSTLDLTRHDFARKSILNFGFPDIAHRTIDEAGVNDIGGEIETALMQFEPRLIRETVHVERDDTVDRAELKVRFVVAADLACDPVNVPVEFVADLEVDTGKFSITRR